MANHAYALFNGSGELERAGMWFACYAEAMRRNTTKIEALYFLDPHKVSIKTANHYHNMLLHLFPEEILKHVIFQRTSRPRAERLIKSWKVRTEDYCESAKSILKKRQPWMKVTCDMTRMTSPELLAILGFWRAADEFGPAVSQIVLTQQQYNLRPDRALVVGSLITPVSNTNHWFLDLPSFAHATEKELLAWDFTARLKEYFAQFKKPHSEKSFAAYEINITGTLSTFKGPSVDKLGFGLADRYGNLSGNPKKFVDYLLNLWSPNADS